MRYISSIAPTKKQIAFVEDICGLLNINFPTCSDDFTKEAFSKFIFNYRDLYYEELNFLYLKDEITQAQKVSWEDIYKFFH